MTAGGCVYANPKMISHWTLFELVNEPWKGCVEARAEPFDVTDDAPDPRNPDTMFVPYFWSDTSDYSSWNHLLNNNWIADNPLLANTDMAKPDQDESRTVSVLKYRPDNPKSIDNIPPETYGPNKACPDPITPLTNDYTRLSNAVQGMSHWEGSGTNIASGVMWGWRTLSPSAPFTEGAPYGDQEKILVLMTDGNNALIDHGSFLLVNDQHGYGHIRDGRYPAEKFAVAENYIDERTAHACENAKKAGITIFTINFGVPAARTKKLLSDCASDGDKAFYVNSGAELKDVFVKIAKVDGSLRLVR